MSMILFKLFSTLALGAGISFPIVSVVKNTTFSTSEDVKAKAKAAVRIQWVGDKIEKEVKEIVDGLGKVIESPEEKGDEQIVAIELQSWGAIDKDICKKMGYSQNSWTAGVGCKLSGSNN